MGRRNRKEAEAVPEPIVENEVMYPEEEVPEPSPLDEQPAVKTPVIHILKSKIAAGVVIFLSLLIAIVSSYLYVNRAKLPLEYHQIIQNWHYEPIMSITPDVVGCSEYLTNFSFPGTKPGCDCRSATSASITKSVQENTCSSDQLTAGCTAIAEISTAALTKWEATTTTNIFRLCANRLTGFNFFSSDCNNTSFQRCGVTVSDTILRNQFCVPTSVRCPINSIKVAAVEPDTTYTSIFDMGATRIYTSRSVTTSQPIAFSLTTRGATVCNDFSNGRFVYQTSNTPYVLLRGRDTVCNSTDVDSRFINVLQSTEAEFFQANNLLTSMTALPGNTNMATTQFALNVREYVPWVQSGDCRYVHLANFVFLDSLAEQINNYTVGWIIANWFVFLLFGLLVQVFRLKYLWRVRNCFAVPTILLLLIQVALTAIVFWLSIRYTRYTGTINAANCSDTRTNDLIKMHDTTFFATTYFLTFTATVAVIVLFIISMLFFNTIFKCICGQKRKEEDERAAAILAQQEEVKPFRSIQAERPSVGTAAAAVVADSQHGYPNAIEMEDQHPPENKQPEEDDFMLVDQEQQSQAEKYKDNTQRSAASSYRGRAIVKSQAVLKSYDNVGKDEENAAPVRDPIFVVEKNEGKRIFQSKQTIGAPPPPKNIFESQMNSRPNIALLDEGEEDASPEQNKKKWEFDIEDYVKKHREKQISSSRIGGGYEITKKDRAAAARTGFQPQWQNDQPRSEDQSQPSQKLLQSQLPGETGGIQTDNISLHSQDKQPDTQSIQSGGQADHHNLIQMEDYRK